MQTVEAPAPRRLDGRVLRVIAAATTSGLGDGIADVALGLTALTYTSDARLVAAVWVAARLPWLLLGHAIASRVDRLRRPVAFMVAADATRLGALTVTALLVGAGHGSLGLLYATAFVIGAGEIGHSGAAQIVLPMLAEGDELVRANGLLQAGLGAGYGVIGPALGGVAVAVGPATPFVADAASFGVSALLLAGTIGVVNTAAAARADAGAAPERADRPAHRVIASHPLLRILTIHVIAMAMGQAMVMSILPVFGREQLHLATSSYGLLVGVAAVGNILGALAAPRVWAGRRHTAALLIGGGALAGASYVLAGFTRVVVLVGLLFLVEAIVVGIYNTVSPTLRMEHAPPESRARIGTTIRQALFIAQPIGAVLAGVLTRAYGVTSAFALGGSIMLATVMITDRPLRRAVREAGA